MNTQREHLDDAIDAVAARMTRVEENDALATRILASLPDRSQCTGGRRGCHHAVLAIGVTRRSTDVQRSFTGRSTDGSYQFADG